MPTLLWDVQEALVPLFAAAVPSGVKVHRGPRGRTASEKRYVLVGTDGGTTGVESGDDQAMNAVQQESDMGPGGWRDEAGSVTCSVWSWTGSSKADIPRDDAKAIYEACEAAVLANRSLGGLSRFTEVTTIGIREEQTNAGPVVRVVFAINYLGLVTP